MSVVRCAYFSRPRIERNVCVCGTRHTRTCACGAYTSIAKCIADTGPCVYCADQTGGRGDYSKFAEGDRTGEGDDEQETEPEPAEQGRGEGVEEPVGMQEDVQMRVIFASHSDSEDDYRYLCPAPPPETEAGADHGGGG